MSEKTQLKQILKDQQLELLNVQDIFREREQSPYLKEMLSSALVKVVMGIRRSGKSSLCKSLAQLDEIAYVNFDDERLTSLETSDLNNIYQLLQELKPEAKIFYFDEIQNVDKWELFINRLQRNKINILLTGSNGKLLGSDLATHLTGRQVSLHLFPLSFKEYLKWKQIDVSANWDTKQNAVVSAQFELFFTDGGFPEVVLGENVRVYLQELFDKIVSRDIAQRYKVREIKLLKEMASYLTQNSGQFINGENLKKTFKVKSLSSIHKYIQYLLDSFLIFELRAYSYKLKERSTSARKIYSCDLGMVKALWSKPTLDLGAKLETVVFLELIKAKKEVYYLREQNMEVDFCVVEDGKISTLIQVCYDLSDPKTKEREVRSLVALGKKYRVKNLTIVTRDDEQEIIEGDLKIQVIPVYKF